MLKKGEFKGKSSDCPTKDRNFTRIYFRYVEPYKGKAYRDSIGITFEQPEECCLGKSFNYKEKKACIVKAVDYYFNIQYTDDIAIRISTNSKKGENFSKEVAEMLKI